ncbi:DapH/DapD/GlmU-related protein [Streptococcus alactolyticus]|uniref:DapH/DapD/GlmU-related protein n=1 Tax=Streptococcus alactolyticus TaxID=29389 RepID=UPI003D034C7A
MGDGCWIGADVIILPGVTIGRGCVIVAGSVVIKDVEPNSLYVSQHKIKKLS